jgi:polyisoprenoid-binding protein YceI
MTVHPGLVPGVLFVCTLAPWPTSAAQLLPAQSEIVFTTRQMGVPVEGRFGRFSAQITLDPKKPEAGTVNFVIDTGSARFGSAELDGEVGKTVWLNVPRFAQASFQSSGVKTTGPGRFEVTGKLRIKGTVQDLVVPVQWAQAGTTGTASGSFTIRRLAFKVGEDEWSDTSLLADEVVVRFKLALSGLAAP